MMKRCFAFLLVLCLLPISAIAMDEPQLRSAPMALLYEETTDTWIFTKNAGGRNPMASLTKIMTAMLVLEYDPDLSGETVVPAEALSEENCYWMNDVHLQEGEQITVRELMEYLLICSGNEAATTLAIYVAGSIPAFLERMNAKAAELGLIHTVFYDPHGLDPQNISTCEEVLILSREAMKNPLFREIVGTASGALPVSNKRTKPYRYASTNRVMAPRNTSAYDGGFSEDIVGIKTGSLSAAGLNLSCCMEYEGLRFYSVVMHAGDVRIEGDTYSGHHIDTLSLMTYARQFQKVGYAAGDTIRAATLGSLQENVTLTVAEDLFVLAGENHPEIRQELHLGLFVKKGDRVGTLTLTDAFGNTRTADLMAAEAAATGLLSYAAWAAAPIMAVAAAILYLRRKKAS